MDEEIRSINPEPAGGADNTEFRGPGIGRREVLKALSGIPVVGVLFYNAFRKKWRDDYRRERILEELGLDGEAPAFIQEAVSRPPADRINLGVIGYGGEGAWLVQSAGFVPRETTDRMKERERRDSRYTGFRVWMDQDDLNLQLTAVCDVYDPRAERAMDASRNPDRPGGTPENTPGAKRYQRYQDLLESGEVDAVLIATPDHWHARMTIDAASQGIHVYCEKAMTRIEEEARAVRRAVKDSGIKFQLGHQNRQIEGHERAKDLVRRGILGPINLVETTTNRNDPIGAWVYEIEEEAIENPSLIDWEQFQEPTPNKVPLSLERFFRWRKWFDYGTGLSGDLFSHEYDAVNQILEMGIPATVAASGGIYYYKTSEFHKHHDAEEFPMTEDRDVPDVFHIVCEYPHRDLTVLYSATLSNSRGRGLFFMGHDATMRVGGDLIVSADRDSTRYRQKIRERVIDTSMPMFQWRPGARGIDAVTTPTEEYFASRGLMYTWRAGRQVSTNHLHIAEWLDCIRYGGEPSCNIDRGFEEAITCHMATQSYLQGRRVSWDPVRERIV